MKKIQYLISAVIFTLILILPTTSYAGKSGLSTLFGIQNGGAVFSSKLQQPIPLHLDLGKQQIDPQRTWTLMVYMDGDNDLEKFAIEDLNEMELGIGASVEVIVLVDRAEKYDTSNGNWKDVRIYRIQKDNDRMQIHSQVLAKPGELNLGDVAVLQEFMRASLQAFPAKHYGLIMWDHGGGWMSHALDLNAPNSQNGKDHLTLPELSSAIEGAIHEVGIKRLDIIGFDMCLMAQLETATQLQGLGTVMVASEAIEPDQGWPYDRILPEFSKGTRGARRLASVIVQKYAKFYSDVGRPYTMSALDLDLVDKVINALNQIVDQFDVHMDQLWALISRTIFYAEAYTDRTKETRQKKHALASMDLMDALKYIHYNAPEVYRVQKVYDTLVEIMDRFVLAEETSSMHARSNGISIYAPTNKINFNDAYLQIRFAKESHWLKMLQNLYDHQRHQSNPMITGMKLVDYAHNQIKETQTASPLSTQGVMYTFNGKNILWLNGIIGYRSKNGKKVIVSSRSTVLNANTKQRTQRKSAGDKNYMLPQYRDGSNQGIIHYGGYHYAVTDGQKAYEATMIFPLHENAIVVSVRYDHPETGKLFGQIIFDTQWWVPKSLYVEIPQKNAPPLYRQIEPKRDANITLLFEMMTEEGNVSYSEGETLQWGNGPELVLALDIPDTYTIGLVAKVIGGDSKIKFYDFKVIKNTALEEIVKKGSKYSVKDLIGTWDYIDTHAFTQNNQVVPLGLDMTFASDPKSKTLLQMEMHASKKPNTVTKASAFLDMRMLPHLRLFPLLEKNGTGSASTFSVYITLVFKMATGKYVMMQTSMLGGRTLTAIKRTPAASNVIAKPVKKAISTSPYKRLTGIWYMNDGEILTIQNDGYHISEAGQEVDRGTYQIQNDLIVTTSIYTEVKTKFVFSLQGDTLYLQDGFGNQYQYTRSSY
jgi:hypothetical protein